MHKGPKEARSFLKDLSEVLEQKNAIIEAVVSKKIELALFPPFVSIPTFCDFNHKLLRWEAECALEEKGAFTVKSQFPCSSSSAAVMSYLATASGATSSAKPTRW